MVKQCAECCEEKYDYDFYVAKDGRVSTYCRECAKDKSRRNYVSNGDKKRAKARLTYAANPEKYRERRRAAYAANPSAQKFYNRLYVREQADIMREIYGY